MKISVYSKSGERAATSFYRLYQYIDNLPGKKYYRKMIPEKIYRRIMPISSKPTIIKGLIFIFIYIRVLGQLMSDLIISPDVLIISRRFINRIMPISYKLILESLKRKHTKIIWDFDDNIVESRELSSENFNYLSRIADHIIVASPYNKNMVPSQYQHKVVILPTTDGYMQAQFNKSIENERLKKYDNEIRIIWVGTSSSLNYLEEICPHIEHLGQLITDKKIIFTVVCNQPLPYSPSNFKLRFVEWERDIATDELLNSHIGIMPLDETKFTQGKGGFKLIQYLSVGLPVIGSSVGINKLIITGKVGFCVSSLSSSQWVDNLYLLATTKTLWQEYSANARNRWLNNYSFDNNLNYWKNILE